MKSEKNSFIYIFIAIAFILIFLIFAAKPLAKEYHYKPQWKVNISNPTLSQVKDKQTMYYRLGQTIGYITNDGELTLNQTFPSKVSISDTYYATYNTNSLNIPFYFSDGTKAGNIEAAGFPYFYKNHIYTFLPGGASFVKCKPDGKTDWKYEGTISLTAFNVTDNYTIAGFANGTVKIFNNLNGAEELTFAPGGSDAPVILGCDVSEDGKYIATVSGHNKQRFVLSHNNNNQVKIIYHKFLETDSPNQTLVHFCDDHKRVIYNYENRIGIYDFSKEINNSIEIDKSIISIKETDNLIVLLGKNKNDYSVYMIDKNNALAGYFSFKSQNAFINTDANSLYIGKDNSISKIELEIK